MSWYYHGYIDISSTVLVLFIYICNRKFCVATGIVIPPVPSSLMECLKVQSLALYYSLFICYLTDTIQLGKIQSSLTNFKTGFLKTFSSLTQINQKLLS